MRVKDALKKLKTYQKLMELNAENEFKIKQFASFIIELENSPFGLKELLRKAQLGQYKMTENKQVLLYDLLETGTFSALDELLMKTPAGVLEMTKISGLGPKKIRVIWQDLAIIDLKTLKDFCASGQLSSVKGFGEKTAKNVEESIDYYLENKSKLLISQADLIKDAVLREILDFLPDLAIEVVGDYKRNLNTVDKIQFAIESKDKSLVFGMLNNHDMFEKDLKNSTMFCWRGFLMDVECPIEVVVLGQNKGLQLLKLNSSEHYLASLPTVSSSVKLETEEEVYQHLGLTYISAPLREVEHLDFINSSAFDLNKIVKSSDLKGCLHNHSVYSDGQNTIAEMVVACKALGLTYFGISDHSKTASYAGGLSEEQVIAQHLEIDEWNSRSIGFKVFKGIESDILANGDLDYDAKVLASFDFIVSSIHANLTMKKEDATQRILKAIENPYTTILGHPTGRLLLKRPGYDLYFDKIIDACVANKVCIEINSNPWRLDLDWTHVRKAVDKGVIVAINPDAHEIDGIQDMQYGVRVAKKCGLYPEQILNCWEKEEVEKFFVASNS